MTLLLIVLWVLACPALGNLSSWIVWVVGSPIVIAIIVLLHPVLASSLLTDALRIVVTALAAILLLLVSKLVHILRRDGLFVARMFGAEPVDEPITVLARVAEPMAVQTVPARRPGAALRIVTERVVKAETAISAPEGSTLGRDEIYAEGETP